MSALLRTLYGYHAWANADLFDKLSTLDETQAAERQTALRLLNHVLVVSRIFAAHLSGTEHDYTSSNTEETPMLDELRGAFAEIDNWYLDYVCEASPVELSERVAFRFTDGDEGMMTREEMLAHIVTHSGYHRGEVGRMLWQLSVTPPWDTFAVYLHQAAARRTKDVTASIATPTCA